MSNDPRLVLASTSSYRRDLLSRLGLSFEVCGPECDEDDWKGRGLGPSALAQALARAKAESVRPRFPEAWVLGSDQVCSLGEEVLGKPGDTDRATRMLMRLQGSEHRLCTAVALIGPDGVREHLDVTSLHMRTLDAAAAARYVEADRPLDCAGAYKLESRGIALFSRIESDDHTAVTGLPLMAVTSMLLEAGFKLP